MRFPSPVLINPLAKKNARAINHGMGSPNAEKAAANVNVLVSTLAPSPIKATAPSGNGCVMMPTIVARNIESNCHAFFVTPAGVGMNQMITPVNTDASNGFIDAPCHGSVGGAGAGTTEPEDADADADADAFTVNNKFCLFEEGFGNEFIDGIGVIEEMRFGVDLGVEWRLRYDLSG